MAKLAIKGHETRGKEVIEILEMLGGVNSDAAYGNLPNNWNVGYYIFDGVISVSTVEILTKKNFKIYTLEKFLNNFPYKVGDKAIDTKTNRIVEIYKAHWSESNNCTYYDVKLPNNTGCVRSYKFLQPYKEETIEGKITMNEDKGTLIAIDLTLEIKKANEIEVILGDYEFVLKDGKTYFVKKNKYPKTYEECCDTLKIPNDERYIDIDVPLDYNKLLSTFTKLLICRNTYWKIAGEGMGLGKPWEPDWLDTNTQKYCIYYVGNEIKKQPMLEVRHFLAFPTKELQDAFFEYFKDLIEECKELL